MRRTDAARLPEREDHPAASNDDVTSMIAGAAAQLAGQDPVATLRSARQQFERDYVTLVLKRHHGSVGDAARALGIQRTNLYRKARQLGIPVARTER